MSVTDPEALLLLPRLSIQNANAISSPLTWGFPSPGAFTGFVHALQRRVGISSISNWTVSASSVTASKRRYRNRPASAPRSST